MIIREIKDVNYIKKRPVYTHIYKKNNRIINPSKINFPLNRIPPAYPYAELFENSKDLLAKCRDAENRPQYIYSKEHHEKQNNKKYCSLLKPLNNLEQLLVFISSKSKQKTEKEKAITTLLQLMTQCHFRIGNNQFEKRYGSFGLTTLHKSHFKKDNRGLEIEFMGKKGVVNQCHIPRHTSLHKNLVEYLDKSNEYIFEYDGKKLDSKDVNEFLRDKMNIRAKDLRTYFANLLFINELKNHYPQNKKELNIAIETVATKLHHTKSICKSSYIYPPIISDVEEGGKNFNKSKSAIDIFKHYLKKNC